MDYTLIGLKNTFCFHDDILIVSKDSEEDHFEIVTDSPKKLDADKLCMNIPACHFGKPAIAWLGCNITQLVIAPVESKTSGIFTYMAKLPICQNYLYGKKFSLKRSESFLFYF